MAMRKIIITIIPVVLLTACGNNNKQPIHNATSEYYPVIPVDSTAHSITHDDTAENNVYNDGNKGYMNSDNMRGFDPSSEDDMPDNGMSRYFDNNDDEGWD